MFFLHAVQYLYLNVLSYIPSLVLGIFVPFAPETGHIWGTLADMMNATSPLCGQNTPCSSDWLSAINNGWAYNSLTHTRIRITCYYRKSLVLDWKFILDLGDVSWWNSTNFTAVTYRWTGYRCSKSPLWPHPTTQHHCGKCAWHVQERAAKHRSTGWCQVTLPHSGSQPFGICLLIRYICLILSSPTDHLLWPFTFILRPLCGVPTHTLGTTALTQVWYILNGGAFTWLNSLSAFPILVLWSE